VSHRGKAPQNGLSMPTSAMGVCFRPVVLLVHNELALLIQSGAFGPPSRSDVVPC
jgi:hypothetical protein